MKRTIVTLLALSMIVFAGYGCDTGTGTGNVCTDNVGTVGGTIATKLYYPCNISSPTGATTMSAGYTQYLQNVAWLSNRVAREGYVVLAFTPSNNLGMVSGWATAHKNCINKLRELNNTHAILRGKIDVGKLQTCGHSKGGGGSLWASSQLGSMLKTTIGMAPYNMYGTEGPNNQQIRNISSATLIQAGGSDTLATNSMTRGEFGALGNIPKMYVEYSGYDHLAWTSTANVTRQQKIGDHVVAWMKYYMDGNTSYASSLSDQSGTKQYNWMQ
jgi:hypothetical protein